MLFLAGLLAVALVIALGSRNDDAADADVGARVQTYFTALADRDFVLACSAVTTDFRRRLADYSATAFPELGSSDCPAIAARIAEANGDELVGLQRRVRVSKVDVDGDTALATFGPGQTAALVGLDDAWLIDRLEFDGALRAEPDPTG